MVRQTEVNVAWSRLQHLISNWRIGILPGVTLTGLVIALRLLGMFQSVEWRTLDLFLRLRPAEPTDERVLIVAINENDIQTMGTYPIPDADLAALLRQLDRYQPRAVGIDIFRDLPVEPGHQTFVKTLEDLPYVFGIEFLHVEIEPPPSLPDERVGFVDFLLDKDGFVRRSLLGSPKPNQLENYRFSLAIRLAEAYLSHEQIPLENGINNPDAMRFGSVELPPFRSNTGGYVNVKAEAQQTLLHFRSGSEPFRQVSLKEVMSGHVDPDWIRNSVVLIGITSPAHKDFVSSAAVASSNPGTVYGVEMHAHAVSQILSAVLDNRPLLSALPDLGDYLWILLWGAAGIVLVGFVSTPSRHLLLVLVTSAGLVTACYVALLAGWWIPVEPALIAFLLNGLVLPGFLLYDQMLRSRIEEGQRVINHAYVAMHNGPLQTLALILRDVDGEQAIDTAQISPRLHRLNQEIRSLYETLEKELENPDKQLYLKHGSTLALNIPLHELLYQVYTQTLERDFPNFRSIQLHVVKFEPMQTQYLKTEEKRYLCRFLEEALCNVGRHAHGVTRLKVMCLATEQENLILVEDNGKSESAKSSEAMAANSGGRGTQQAQQFVAHLNGQFKRTAVAPHGMRCELRWPIQ